MLVRFCDAGQGADVLGIDLQLVRVFTGDGVELLGGCVQRFGGLDEKCKALVDSQLGFTSFHFMLAGKHGACPLRWLTAAAAEGRYNTHVKVLVLSDPHANWHALQAVLEDCQGTYDQVVCCGDLVGYNAYPGKVVDWAHTHCQSVIRGNHDKAVAGLEDLTWFNEIAQTAARWSVEQLSDEQMAYLRDLEQGPVKLDRFQLFHGSPQDEDEYITAAFEAATCFPHLELPLSFFGHTHLQGGFFLTRGRVGSIAPVRSDRRERVIELEPDVVYMVNPGSVGQPRDGDPRAGYAIFNSGDRTVTLRRAEYPIEEAASAIRTAGLPDALAARLFQGS